MFKLITLVLMFAFIANLLMSKFTGALIISEQAEVLLLFGAATSFAVTILLAERKRNQLRG